MNKITISGRIVKEPILTTIDSSTKNNKHLARFIIKVPRTYKGKTIFNYFPCIAYDNNAKLVEKAWNKNHKDIVLNGILLSKKNQDVLENKKEKEDKDNQNKETSANPAKNIAAYTPLLILAKSIEVFISHSLTPQSAERIESVDSKVEKPIKSGQTSKETRLEEDDMIKKDNTKNRKEPKTTSAKLNSETNSGFLTRLKKKKTTLKKAEKDKRENESKNNKDKTAKNVTNQNDKKNPKETKKEKQLYDEMPKNLAEKKINHFEKTEEEYIEELEALIMMYDDDIYL